MAEEITGYYFAPAMGYAKALHVVRASGACECYSTGPHVDTDLAVLRAAGVPEVPCPFAG